VAFRIREFTSSRSGNQGKDSQDREIVMTGDGSADDAIAKAAFAAFAPPVFDGLTLTNIRYEFLGGLLWRGTAQYNPDSAPAFPAVGIVGPPTPVPNLPGPNDPLGPHIDFDFTGANEKITQAKELISKTKRGGGVAPDTKLAIGVTQDGTVEGCEKISPNLELIITATFTSVSSAYIQFISGMVGGTNNAIWFGRPIKSLIFLGGQTQSKDTFRKIVTFKFLERPNKTDILICDELIVPAKAGSDYLWVSYKNIPDAGKLTQQPDAAYVMRVCDLVNFEDLRIGV